MKRFTILLTALFGTFSLVTATFAWDSTGHMIIAAMAWQEFALAERARALAILEHHPEFAAWKRAFESGPRNVDFGAYAFMRAATWPDDISLFAQR